MRLGLLFLPGKRYQDETVPLEEADRRYFLEFVIVFAIISGLIALYVRQFTVGIEKAKLVEAFSVTQTARGEVILHYAETGKWPEPLETEIGGNYVSSVRWSGHALVSELRLPETPTQESPRWTLSFTPVTNQGPTAVVVWLCGDAEPPPGMIRKAASTTSVPASVLPSTCRPRRYIDE